MSRWCRWLSASQSALGLWEKAGKRRFSEILRGMCLWNLFVKLAQTLFLVHGMCLWNRFIKPAQVLFMVSLLQPVGPGGWWWPLGGGTRGDTQPLRGGEPRTEVGGLVWR